MNNYLICKKCSEMDDKKAKTGASIDGVYYCGVCYNDCMDKIELNYILKVFEERTKGANQ